MATEEGAVAKKDDKQFMKRAINLALSSERAGNIPVGAIVVLGDEIVGEGKSEVLAPTYHPGKHAEIMALRSVPDELWPRAREMTCYTTLEPCVMCAGTLLLHGVGRVVFGANDELGGASSILDSLPPYYDAGGVYTWEGPLLPQICDPLYRRADEIFSELPVGRASWEPDDEQQSPSDLLDELQIWVDTSDDTTGIRAARSAASKYMKRFDGQALEALLPYLAETFRRTGYLKDYRRLKRAAKSADRLDALEDVDEAVKRELPDIWIKRALKRRDFSEAIEYWFEIEDHPRARHVADDLVRIAGADPDLVASARMSQVEYLIGRKKRSKYRHACNILRKLRDELDSARAQEYWPLILEDIQARHGRLRALQDELEKAGFI